jgi:hypothetical protein
MPDVKQVIVIVSNPTGAGDTGRATIGYYKLEGDLLTMTDGNGTPIRRRSGDLVKQKLQPGDDAVLIAKRLTMSIYRMARGDGVEGFNRPLSYPKSGLA